MNKLEEVMSKYSKGDIVISTYGNKKIVRGAFRYSDDGSVFVDSIIGTAICLYDAERDVWAENLGVTGFTQDDIKAGMKVQYRNGDYRLAIEIDGEIVLIGNSAHNSLSHYTNFKNEFKDIDIVKVIKAEHDAQLRFNNISEGEVVWEEKKEIPEFTMDELKDKLGMDFKIKSTK